MDALRNSFLYRLFVRISEWWDQTALVTWLTGQVPERSASSLAKPITATGRAFTLRLFQKLHLRELFSGSLFLHPILFAAAALILAPVLPTMAILALVCGSFFSMFLKLGIDRAYSLAPSALNAYIVLYAFVYGFATVTSVSFRGSLFHGLLTIAFVLFFFGITSAGITKKTLDRILWMLLAVGVGISLYGFYQYLSPEQFTNVWTDSDMFSSIAFRVYSTLENPNVLGEYFLLIIPIVCAMMLTEGTWPRRIVCLIAAGIMGVCLILTYSRGCYLGLLFAAAVFLVLLDRRFLILGIIAVLLCPLYLPDSVISRFTSIGNTGDSSTSYRVNIWLGTLAMLKDYWLCGIGPGAAAFNTVYPEYAVHATTAQHAHNLFLQIICDTGIVGLTVFLILLVSFYRMMFTAIRAESDQKARVLQIAGTASITGFLVQSMTDYTFYNYRVMLLFFCMLGLCVVFTRTGSREEVK